MKQKNTLKKLLVLGFLLVLSSSFFAFSVSAIDWNDELLSYWNFDENTGTAVADSGGDAFSLNLSLQNGATWGSGLLGDSALSCNDNVNDQASSDSSNYAHPGFNYTFSMWIYQNVSSDANDHIFKRWQTVPSVTAINVITNTTNGMSWLGQDGESTAAANTHIPLNQWNHLVLTVDQANNGRMYFNGVQVGNNSAAQMSPNGGGLYFCRNPEGGGMNPWQGKIDEVSYWNRSLTTDDVSDLYNSGAGITLNQQPNLPPVIISNATIPSSIGVGEFNVYVNVTLNDSEFDLISQVLFSVRSPNNTIFYNRVNGTRVGSNYVDSPPIEEWHSGYFNISNYTAHLGTWNWNYTIVSNSSSGSQNTTQTGSFSISDSQDPNITIINPVNSGIYYRNFSIPLNFSIYDDVELNWCAYTLNGGVGNNTISDCSSNSSLLFGASPGLYNLTIWANDTSNNLVSSTALNVDIQEDTTVPNLTIVNPTGDYSATTEIPLDYITSDLGGLSTCYYNVTRGASQEVADTAIPGCTNTTFSVSGFASYVLNLRVTDLTGNVNISNISFSVSDSGGGSGGDGGSGGGGGGGSTTGESGCNIRVIRPTNKIVLNGGSGDKSANIPIRVQNFGSTEANFDFSLSSEISGLCTLNATRISAAGNAVIENTIQCTFTEDPVSGEVSIETSLCDSSIGVDISSGFLGKLISFVNSLIAGDDVTIFGQTINGFLVVLLLIGGGLSLVYGVYRFAGW